MGMDKTSLMQYVLGLARHAGEKGEVPVAAIITNGQGDIIIEAQNQMQAQNCPTAHAELLAIDKLHQQTGAYYFSDYHLFVSLEPCPMCAHAIALSRFKGLYFAAYDVKGGGVDNGARIFAQQGCNHIPDIIGGLCAAQAEQILQDFFQNRR